MNRGFPSMTALLGLLAVAGYQNRDKLAELFRGAAQPAGPGGIPSRDARPGGLDGLLGGLGGGGLGSVLGGGLKELVERFSQTGHRDTVESWVGTGPNRAVTPTELEQAIGADVLATLSRQTGLSRDELLARLSRDLPQAVDQYTPHGRLPTDRELG